MGSNQTDIDLTDITSYGNNTTIDGVWGSSKFTTDGPLGNITNDVTETQIGTQGDHIAAIIGGCAGGTVLIIVIIVVLIMWRRSARTRRGSLKPLPSREECDVPMSPSYKKSVYAGVPADNRDNISQQGVPTDRDHAIPNRTENIDNTVTAEGEAFYENYQRPETIGASVEDVRKEMKPAKPGRKKKDKKVTAVIDIEEDSTSEPYDYVNMPENMLENMLDLLNHGKPGIGDAGPTNVPNEIPTYIEILPGPESQSISGYVEMNLTPTPAKKPVSASSAYSNVNAIPTSDSIQARTTNKTNLDAKPRAHKQLSSTPSSDYYIMPEILRNNLNILEAKPKAPVHETNTSSAGYHNIPGHMKNVLDSDKSKNSTM